VCVGREKRETRKSRGQKGVPSSSAYSHEKNQNQILRHENPKLQKSTSGQKIQEMIVTPCQCQYYAAGRIPDPVERTNETIGIAVLPPSTISKTRRGNLESAL
jgi:hypothetical protein